MNSQPQYERARRSKFFDWVHVLRLQRLSRGAGSDEVTSLKLYGEEGGRVARGKSQSGARLPTRWAFRWKVLLVAAGLAVLMRLGLGLAAHGNLDTEAYGIVARLVDGGKSVYANTERYNYGPWWGWTVWVLWRVSGYLSFPNAFHFCISALVTAVDFGIALILARRFSFQASLFFLLCPVSILITGVHGQFDNVAVLLGLAGWMILFPTQAVPSWGRLVGGAALIGLSLSVKHVLAFFPLWLLFYPGLGSLRRRLLVMVFAYLVFAVSFLPWAGDAASRNGIVQHVLLYRGQTNNGLMARLINLFFPLDPMIANFSVTWGPMLEFIPMVCWYAALLGIGWWAGRRQPLDLLFIYLLAMVGLSPTMADQYLSIPLVACAVMYRYWPVWLYTVMATLQLLFSPSNLHLFACDVPMLAQTQLWLMVLLLAWLQNWVRRDECGGPSLSDKGQQALRGPACAFRMPENTQRGAAT